MRPTPELMNNRPLKGATGRGPDVWKLFVASVDGDLDTVKQLINNDPAIVRTQVAYRTPIYFAVRENRIPVVEFLLQSGADPLSTTVDDSLLDICRDRGYTDMANLLQANFRKIHGASSCGETVARSIRDRDMGTMCRLLDQTPDLLHVGDERSNQPIHWAVMTRQLDMIDELIGRGADLEAKRYDGARPIQLFNGDYHFRGWRDVPKNWPTTPNQVLDHLRMRGAHCDICTACHVGDFQQVSELLQEDPTLANRPSEYVSYYLGSGTPLKNAASSGHLEIMRLLLDYGADPNLPEENIAPDGHALYAAVVNRHHDIVRLLLEHGAIANAEVESSADALSRAIMNDDQDMIDLLCSYGAYRRVHLLAYYNDLRTAAAVFAANPQLADDPEALANAAGEGHTAFVRLMLKYQPDLPRRLDFPAWSVGAKTEALNELLFQHGMDASHADWLGITPLHQFARKGNVEFARLFIRHGANLHARDEHLCSTPLGWAAKFGQFAMVQLLVECGAILHHPADPPWATPLAWAERRGHPEIAQWLRQH